MLRVLAHRFTQQIGLAHHIADVIGHLVSLSQAVAQGLPLGWVRPGAQCTGAGGSHKQRAGLGALVLHERYARLRFPGLTGHDAAGHTHAAGDDL